MAVPGKMLGQAFTAFPNYKHISSVGRHLTPTCFVPPSMSIQAYFCVVRGSNDCMVDVQEAAESSTPTPVPVQEHSNPVEQNEALCGSDKLPRKMRTRPANPSLIYSAAHMKRCGKVMKSMLHKTYWNMKDRKLVQNAELHAESESESDPVPQSSTDSLSRHSDLITLERTFYPGRRKLSKEVLRAQQVRPAPRQQERKESSLGTKELFFHKMYVKYQNPSDETAATLSQRYGDPEVMFTQVTGPLLEAAGQEVPQAEVTSHLRQVYWRVRLSLPWCHTLTATHPQRDRAVRGVFLRACQQLEKLGLIWHDRDGRWQPMTCDRVVVMLETLAKYVESSLITSKGRGFKIVLNRAKPSDDADDAWRKVPKQNEDQKQESASAEECSRVLSSSESSDPELSQPCYCLKENRRGCESKLSIGLQERPRTSSLYVNSRLQENNKPPEEKHFAHSNIPEVGSPQILSNASPEEKHSISNQPAEGCKDTWQPAQPRAQWECTVHVGWPFPFTVTAQGVSLPGAQMLGYMAVVSKLKSLGLLTSCNSAVSPQVLGRLMRIDVQVHWEKSLQSSWDQALLHKFSADAELFCDASVTGFGAYLVLKEIGKVRWLCEAWEDHDGSFLDVIYPRRWMFESTLAELYATVTSVYSWKKKLRGKRLLCFSDNQCTVALINSHMEKPVRADRCIHPLDRLVSSLQATCSTYNIALQAAWLERDRNTLADLLSRRDTQAFQSTVPGAAGNKTRAKRLSIPWAHYQLKQSI